MAAQQAMMAQQKAFAERQIQEAAPVRAQTSQALTATTTEMTQGMRENPRFARLMNHVDREELPAPAGYSRSRGDKEGPVPKISPSILMGVTLLMSMGVAQAQFASPGLGFGVPRDRGAAGPIEPVDEFDPAICDDIASLPNPPMSLEACRSMMMMQQSMKSASSDPNAFVRATRT